MPILFVKHLFLPLITFSISKEYLIVVLRFLFLSFAPTFSLYKPVMGKRRILTKQTRFKITIRFESQVFFIKQCKTKPPYIFVFNFCIPGYFILQALDKNANAEVNINFVKTILYK